MRITLVEPAYLMPSLVRALTEAGCLVAPPTDASLEVSSPWLPSAVEAAAFVSARANGWAALHGARIEIDPAPPRFAHPMTRSGSGGCRVGQTGPSVSIGVPVYNGERYLEQALASLVSQTFGDIEIIVCDNGSTDATARISQAFARRDERVSVHRSEMNRGAAWNYNRALALARGRYFKWAAHDDLCGPAYIERCVEVLDRAPMSVVVAYPRTVIVDESGKPVGTYEDGLDLRQARPHERVAVLIRNLVLSNAVFGLMRTDVLRGTRGHGSYISADYVLLVELALAGQFWEIPEPLFFRRAHEGTSRAANRTSAEVAEWFDPGSGDEKTTEFLRLFAEYLRAIERADLSRADRLAVYRSTVPLWLRRFHGSMRRELLEQAASSLRIRSRNRSAEREDAPDRVAVSQSPVRLAVPVGVHELVRRVIWQVAPDYAPKIGIHVDPTLTIDADIVGMETIVANLISNAVRYGDVPITVSVDAGDEFTLTVEDSGRGVADAFTPHLFEAFARSEESREEAAGAGLGLAVARMAAEAAGGSLVYERARTGGACFRLVYPGSVLRRHAPPNPAVDRHAPRPLATPHAGTGIYALQRAA